MTYNTCFMLYFSWVPGDGRCMYKVRDGPPDEQWGFKIIEDCVFFVAPFVVTIICYILILVKVGRDDL